jgi:hypothetical protein
MESYPAATPRYEDAEFSTVTLKAENERARTKMGKVLIYVTLVISLMRADVETPGVAVDSGRLTLAKWQIGNLVRPLLCVAAVI